MFFFFLFFSIKFVASKKEKEICNLVNIKIIQSNDNHFLENKDIWNILDSIPILNEKIKQINISLIENKIIEHTAVEKAEVYKNINGNLNIEIKQQTPILRIIDNENNSYYINKNAEIMPLADNYTARVLVANGFIPHFEDENFDINIKKEATILLNLYDIANFIYNNDFWDTQIQQIYVNQQSEFELIPCVGAHTILLGNAENIKEKFRNLEVFYKEGFKFLDWNKYKIINLKYKNQIIGVKR